MSKSFGQALGELIREKRGQAGFSQLELAQEAFEDESKVRRIGDLERGHIANPQIKTIQPIIDTLNITKAELDACRNIRLSAAQLDQIPTLSRDALELLASRFEIETPHTLQDAQLRSALTQKAEEYRTYRSAIDALDDRVAGVANLKGAAQDAADRLDFDEVEALLSRVDEVETEIAADTKLTRARNALLQDKPARAFAILSAAADSFASVSAIKPAEFRTDHALLLYAHSLRYGGPGLALAAKMYRDAIAMLDPGDAAQLWARAQNNLAIALRNQGSRTGGADGTALLAQAVTAYRAALTVYTQTDHPVDWAMTQNNLAIALKNQGRRTGGADGTALLAQAVTAYRAALTVRTQTDHPVQWAMTQNNLGAALYEQGSRTGGADGTTLLAQAVTAYRAALTVYTRTDHPVDWAMTQNNLGGALQNQGSRTGGADGIDLLAQAVTACRAALTVRTQTDHPVDWAMTQENLAIAEQALARHDATPDPRPHLVAALAHVAAALTVYDPLHMPYDHGTATALHAALQAQLDAL